MKQLRYFDAVARLGTFSAAAEASIEFEIRAMLA